MIKEDVISKVSNDIGYSKKMVVAVIESTLSNITNALQHGEKVQFSGFGTFKLKKRAARIGRNPHTKEAVPIPARMMPIFTASKSFKKSVSREC